jgi:hypothetical protein
MDTEHELWETWETQFTALAEGTPLSKNKFAMNGALYCLCLYGNNGYTPEQELLELAEMTVLKTSIERVEVDAGGWMDTVLFIPNHKAL